MENMNNTNNTSPFAPIAKESNAASPAFSSISNEPVKEKGTGAFAAVSDPIDVNPEKETIEPTDTFAQGLPQWSLEPPQVVVRRRK